MWFYFFISISFHIFAIQITDIMEEENSIKFNQPLSPRSSYKMLAKAADEMRPYITFDMEDIMDRFGPRSNHHTLALNSREVEIESSPNPESILKETLINLKLGLKPYYQEKLPHPIDGSSDGIYIEYNPEEDIKLTASQKIQWMLPWIVDRINPLYEARKKEHDDHIKAKREYADNIADINKAIKNYKETGHNLFL
jgi:hypothetical protein